MFLHGGWLHLMGNMLFLWIFAVNVEDRLGRPAVPRVIYLVGGDRGGRRATSWWTRTSDIPMIGASGAISAVLGAYLVLFPRARIQSLVFLGFFYQLIAVPAVIVLGFWFLLQLIDGLASLGAHRRGGRGVAFCAHIGGFVAGMVMALPVAAPPRADAPPRHCVSPAARRARAPVLARRPAAGRALRPRPPARQLLTGMPAGPAGPAPRRVG